MSFQWWEEAGWHSPENPLLSINLPGVVTGTKRPDEITVDDPTFVVSTERGGDDVTIEAPVGFVFLGDGADALTANDYVWSVSAGRGNDTATLNGGSAHVDMGRGSDTLTLTSEGHSVDMGRGRDSLTLTELIDHADGGRGKDTITFEFNAGDVDISVEGRDVILTDRFSGKEMVVTNFESFEFADRSFTKGEVMDLFGPRAEVPHFQVGGGTQVLTVNDDDPSVSVIWDRVVQQAVIETEGPNGPTIASRAYATMHTAMYDAWSAYDEIATHVSIDLEGDNMKVTGGTDTDKAKAMSFAALTVLQELYPEQSELYREVMEDRLGYSMEDDGSREAQIGIDAAEDMLALRANDGSNQENGFADTTGYTPVNPSPLEINDITRWTPENVPIDPEDADAEQSFLTAHWLEVEGFALPENPDGSTDFSSVLPDAPKTFFTEEFAGSSLDFAAKEITLGAAVNIDGTDYAAGDTIPVSQALIGTVINAEFIAQAERVIEISAGLTDEQKIIAEFWEDGGGTAFPPGTFMAFAQFVSARDDHSIDDDAQMFMIMGNAVMDADIATWQAKVEYDYARPVRLIRDLGELGLIGELGVDEITGEEGWVIDAFGGFAPDGTGLGTATILAENFITFQRPGADPSPPFAEYTSGHSAFSAAGAEVLWLFTGSDAFGGSVTFDPDTIQFESGVPEDEVTLAWETFTEAADEAGLSRLYGGIHFDDGDLNGRELGREVGQNAYDFALLFFNGTATDADRPFAEDFLIA
ncbi:MAG: DUF6851 domain-containing protein [Pseudomonadota bacterium]